MKIYTLTLNPAYDVHASADDLKLYHENLARVLSREAGGKGVNISRALTANHIPNQAVILLGKENGAEFRQAVSEMDCLFLEVPGRIRENYTFHSAAAPETRISFSGFPVPEFILTQVESLICADENTIVTFTGRVPTGIEIGTVKAFLRQLQNKGAKIVLDSKSFTLEDIYELRPWLIKPNQEEISEYLGCTVENIPQAAEKAAVFLAHGVENVMISLGEQGALLQCRAGSWVAVPPAITAVSTIGAGDSTIAGFLAAASASCSAEDCLRYAVAYGTAACLREGSQPPKPQDVQMLLPQIILK